MDLTIQRVNDETGATEFLSDVLRAARDTESTQYATLIDLDDPDVRVPVALFTIGGESYDYQIARTDLCNCGCGTGYPTGTWYTVRNLKDRMFTLGMLFADHRNEATIAQLHNTVDSLTNRVDELSNQPATPHFEIGDRWLIEDAVDALIRETRRSAEQSVSDYQQRRNSIVERLFGE